MIDEEAAPRVGAAFFVLEDKRAGRLPLRVDPRLLMEHCPV
jgi:hypothetical protein